MHVAGGVGRQRAGLGDRNSNVTIPPLDLSCVLILIHTPRKPDLAIGQNAGKVREEALLLAAVGTTL